MMQTFQDLLTHHKSNCNPQDNAFIFTDDNLDSILANTLCQPYTKYGIPHTYTITNAALWQVIDNISDYISNLNFTAQNIAIVANNSPFWIAADLAIMSSSNVSIPMFPNAVDENLLYQLNLILPSLIIVQDHATLQKIQNIYKNPTQFIILNAQNQAPNYHDVETLSNIITNPAASKNSDPIHITANQLATIVFTSGTSGMPNGVMLSHGNIMSQVNCSAKYYILDKHKDLALLFLPYAHIFQRMVGYLYLHRSVTTFVTSDTKSIPSLLPMVRPTVFCTVPRLLDKIYAKLTQILTSQTGIKGFISKNAYKYAIQHKPLTPHTLIGKLYRKLVFGKIVAKLGKNFNMIISGGAKLDNATYSFLLNIGLPVYQGYGMTECSPVIASNSPSHHLFGSVGKLFDDVEVTIDPQGQILTKGPHVMQGYYNNPQATASIINSDGWLNTGDLGHLNNGYLFVTGRKKEQFKTSTGKYINPVKIEALINQIPEVDNSCIIADNKKFVTLIIFTTTPKLSIDKEIALINKNLESHEQIKKYYAHPMPAATETGEITPSHKLRREFIYTKFAKEIEDFYKD